MSSQTYESQEYFHSVTENRSYVDISAAMQTYLDHYLYSRTVIAQTPKLGKKQTALTILQAPIKFTLCMYVHFGNLNAQ